MRVMRTCLAAALAVLSQVACAHRPPAVNVTMLGQLDATLEHCERVNSAQADAYRRLARGVTGAATEEEIAEARQSAGYREAHAAASEQIEKLPAEQSSKACTDALQAAPN